MDNSGSSYLEAAAAAGVPPPLLPYQRDWVLCRAPTKNYIKTRRAGITFATAYEATEIAASSREAGGMNFWYQTYAEEDAKEFITDVVRWATAINEIFTISEKVLTGKEARKHYVLPEDKDSIRITSVRFRSGFKVTALPHSPRKLRGKGGVYCLDEAAQHEDFTAALIAAQAFQIWKGRIIFISTVTDDENPWWKYCCEVDEGKHPDTVNFRLTLPEAFALGLYKRICLVSRVAWTQEAEDRELARLLAQKGAEQEYLCIPSSATTRYFTRALVESCMTSRPVFRFIKKPEWAKLDEDERRDEIIAWAVSTVGTVLALLPNMPHVLGVDFGRHSDLAVYAPAYLDQALVLNVPFTVELGRIPYKNHEQFFDWLVSKLPRFSFATLDATGNGEPLGEHAVAKRTEEGAEALRLDAPTYGLHFPALRSRFEEKTILLPRDTDILTDFSMVAIEHGKPFVPRKRLAAIREDKTKGETRHADTAIAILCAHIAATKPWRVEGGYEKVPATTGAFSFQGLGP